MKPVLLFALILASTVCRAQTAIDTAAVIQIGGISQYVTIQSSDRSLPLLLFLHGGPGASVMDYADRFTNQLRYHFVVVNWDQRETGRTQQLNASPVPHSLSVFQDDTRALIDTLLRRFNRKKLYLAGHSWGTALGFYIAKHHADLLYAWLPVGPMINQYESETIALTVMRNHALATGNQKALEELLTVHIPFENGAQLYYHRKWLLAYMGSRRKLSKAYVENWASVWLPLFNEASKLNLFESLPEIGCPVYFFAGRRDLQTNASLAEKYFTKLVAPKKGFFWFERSGHGVPTSEPNRLQDVIIGRVLPETFTVEIPEAALGKSAR